ncbi:MAG: XTP/dITP diphosphatase [Candidatus Altiarchaeota archaeon]|nr:XTP/dITP diphosphatase [Candidatus Altiarchaeota archaeon]
MELLFATSNLNKVREANDVGRRFGVRFRQVRFPYPEVRSESVADVALDGVRFVYPMVKKPVIVEDSGLFIEALNGFPGTYSRFVFDKIGLNGVLALMRGKSDRRAYFASAVGFSDGRIVKAFEGFSEGAIARSVKGKSGFGYDPVFIPAGSKRTFAEDFSLKERVSHRAIAFRLLCEWLANRGSSKPAGRSRL